MLLETILESWLRWRLDTYQTTPIVLQSVFVDGMHLGTAKELSPGLLVDDAKRWIPHIHQGGTLVVKETAWPILDNGRSSLTLDGDPSFLWSVPPPDYVIISPETARLQTWLTTNRPPLVVTTFAQIPDQLPCITLRLEVDIQGEVYVGEGGPVTVTTDGIEVTTNLMRMNGRFVLGIWTQDKDSTLWLYSVLLNMFLGGQQEFASWGLAEGHAQGLDVDPVLGFVPQYPHTRHLALTFSRLEQALNLAQLDAIDRTQYRAFLNYAPLRLPLP
jgi:hypothetical protein